VHILHSLERDYLALGIYLSLLKNDSMYLTFVKVSLMLVLYSHVIITVTGMPQNFDYFMACSNLRTYYYFLSQI
jgi:hypothetical protein